MLRISVVNLVRDLPGFEGAVTTGRDQPGARVWKVDMLSNGDSHVADLTGGYGNGTSWLCLGQAPRAL